MLTSEILSSVPPWVAGSGLVPGQHQTRYGRRWISEFQADESKQTNTKNDFKKDNVLWNESTNSIVCLTTKLVGLSKLASTCGTITRTKVVIGEPSSQLKGPQHGCHGQTVLKKRSRRLQRDGYTDYWVGLCWVLDKFYTPHVHGNHCNTIRADIPIHTSSDSCCRDNSACWRVKRVRASCICQQESRNCHKIDDIKIQARLCHHFVYCYL